MQQLVSDFFTILNGDCALFFNGYIDIDKDLLMSLIEKSGDQEVKIKLDGWKKKDKEGNHMVSLKVNTYEKKQQPQVSDPWDN